MPKDACGMILCPGRGPWNEKRGIMAADDVKHLRQGRGMRFRTHGGKLAFDRS